MPKPDSVPAGHGPTLVCALVYFEASFLVWLLPGALGNILAAEFGLSPFQRGLMVAVPILGGSLLRVVMGVLADRLGARRAAMLGLTITLLPLWLGWVWVERFDQLLVVGLLLGVAGASFAAALPLGGRWYPPRQQGLVLGLIGLGNSGTAATTLVAPQLARWVGWHGVFGLALGPIVLALLALWWVAQEAPNLPPPAPWAAYLSVLKQADSFWFSLFYAVTFGGFVGLCAFLPILLHDQYALSAARAGSLATLGALAGALVRPLGGVLADRLGGIRLLLLFFVGVAIASIYLAGLPPLAPAMLALVAIMVLLGMGNGAVFQLVPQRFPGQIGVLSGIVGAAGGLGGFLLPIMLATVQQATGSFAWGFLLWGTVTGAVAGSIGRFACTWEQKLAQNGARATPVHSIPGVATPG